MTTIRAALHNHCTLCDGRSTAREMADAAIAAGFTDFGFSSHGHTPFDLSYALEDNAAYRAEIRALQKEYEGRIRLYCGLEQDYYGPDEARDEYDYIIGSVHYIRDEATGRYYEIDGKPETIELCRDEAFGGDIRRMVEAYFESVALNCEKMRPDVVGHIDVIGRNNAGSRFFDENAAWYLECAFAAIERIVKTGTIFELNSNGWAKRGMCYPAPVLLKKIRELGGRVTINADAHSVGNITLYFDKALEILKETGFEEIWVWNRGMFVPQSL